MLCSGQASNIVPTETMVQQTPQASVTSPMLTSNATTKKKVEHSTTPTVSSTHSTQKKPNSDKGTCTNMLYTKC